VTPTIDRERIERTHSLIRPHIRLTPVMELTGADFGLSAFPLTLKLELFQHAGSFKTRGAFANLLTRAIPAAGVVAASGGNHGAAVAYAAMRLGVPAHIFVPTVSSPAKITRIRAYGADLVVGGDRYADALADAQHRGLAEADPSADVDAHDPAAKLAILAMLAFRRRIDPSHIARVGIRGVGPAQLEAGRNRGFVIKLIAAATSHDDVSIEADVRPRMVPVDAPMARVHGAMNAIALDAQYAGSLVFEGPGAGPDAAASAVLADLLRAAKGAPASAGSLLATLADLPAASVAPLGPKNPYPAAS